MNFKTLKLMCIVLLIVFVISIPTRSQALDDTIKSGSDFIEVGEGENSIIDDGVLGDVSDTVFKVLLAVAIVIAVIWGAFIGIQLMMQGAEGKAQMKEALLPYVIGCVVAFSAFGIWKIVVTALQNTGI